MNKKEVTIFYPKYTPQNLMIAGLFFYEIFILGVLVVGPLLVYGVVGVLFGLMLAGTFFVLLYRKDGRTNLLSQLLSFLNFIFAQQLVLKGEREEIEGENTEVQVSLKKDGKKKMSSNGGGKKSKKKQKKSKNKVMQDYFPFRSIEESYIRMEDGKVYIFLGVQGNNLDFLNSMEVDQLRTTLAKEFNRNKFDISFFMQDALFNINDNIAFAKRKSANSKIGFIRRLGMELVEMMRGQRKDATKKTAYMRIALNHNDIRNLDLNKVINTTIALFKDTLGLRRSSIEELKQMLAIFANRMFTENLPDTELEIESDYEEFLLVKRKKNYERIQLPGIYEFKDLIVPATTSFKPSTGDIGSHKVKTYGVNSFLMSTEEANILSGISTLKGVATSIHLDSLSLSRYKNYVTLDMRSKNSTATDELDVLDAEMDKENIKGSYRRIRTKNQKMFYVTILFQISAKDLLELERLEADFLNACDNVGLIVDPLQTKQKQAWMSVNPLGKNLLDRFIKQNIPSESLANLYPFNDPSVLDRHGLSIGTIVDRNEAVLFDPFSARAGNNNILILGYSGVGKTVLLWLLLQNAAIAGAYIRNIDVEGNCVEFTERLGGINLNMAGNNQYCINPLQIRIPDEIRAGLVDDYISEVKNFMRIYKPSWTDRLLDLFEHFLTLTYKRKEIFNTSDFKRIRPEDYPIFSDVVVEIKMSKETYSKESLGNLTDYDELILGLQSCTQGADAKMFNRPTNLGEYSMDDVQFMNFDIHEILSSDINRKLAQWSNIFTFNSQFVNNNMDRSKDILVAIDELHTFLKKQYMAILEILETYERRFRKYKSSFIKATQTVEELDNDDNDMKDKVKTLFSQPSVKFMFHLGDVNYEDIKKLMSLKDVEVEKLKEKREGMCLMKIENSTYDLAVMMPEWFKEVKKDIKV